MTASRHPATLADDPRDPPVPQPPRPPVEEPPADEPGEAPAREEPPAVDPTPDKAPMIAA